MGDDVVLTAVGLFQLAFGVFLGWLRWGLRKRRGAFAGARLDRRVFDDMAVIHVSPEQLARIDAKDGVPPGLADLVATSGVEVVEATPEEWAPIQQELDAEDAAHALEHDAQTRTEP